MNSTGSKIHRALVVAQSKIHAAGKSGENTYDHYKYAMLQDYCDAIREPMTENELALSVSVEEVVSLDPRVTSQGKTEHVVRVKLKGILSHSSGETLEFFGWGEGQDRADKGLYKAITGGKKYLIADIFNVPTTDDPETDSHEDFDKKAKGQEEAPQTPASAPQTAPATQGSRRRRRTTGRPQGQNAAPRGRSNHPPVNDEEQKKRGCINSTLISELRQAVLKQHNANKLDAVADFVPWIEEYLDALYTALQKQGAKVQRKHKGTAQVLLDIPASAYKEILERVEKEPKTCRAGYAQAAEQEAEQYGDDGVA